MLSCSSPLSGGYRRSLSRFNVPVAVLLAGDAAHLNPPWGGHGFNTGIAGDDCGFCFSSIPLFCSPCVPRLVLKPLPITKSVPDPLNCWNLADCPVDEVSPLFAE
ncbi:MAG: FAD-dependent monooxygenase [Chloroflexota bacterium]|nr:FAD-dependent monooxygenase [Chloroflexota bacterium]